MWRSRPATANGRARPRSASPYAAAFGVATRLVKRGEKLGNIMLLDWFGAIHDAEADSEAFVAFMAASDSSMAGDGGAGAATGASGGGSSAAG
jgi:uncharacterized membrane protein